MKNVLNRKQSILTAAVVVALSSAALAVNEPKAGIPAPKPAPTAKPAAPAPTTPATPATPQAAPAAAPAAAANQSPLQKQLSREFPNAKVDVVDTKEINGVKVHDVRVNGGQTDAVVTDNGDIVMAAIPHGPGDMPADVAAVSQGLFGSAPSHVEAFVINNYIVNITANGKGYELKIDPTGKVTDIDTKQQAQYEDPKKQPKADNADVTKITPLVQQRFPNAKINDVHKSATSAGFFAVDFHENGKYGFISIDEQNRVRSYAMQEEVKDLPQPVQAAVNEIKGAKINSVLHYTTHYWEITQNVGGDTLTMKVRPDGDIISVEGEGAKQVKDAVTASHKQAASNAKKNPS